ncbi:hypothetical protein ACFFJT_06765 [Dyella flava]|uniref:Uncharacterized protein n=1 Tax=Dyella flava TaxID=1920170 RepID=A0ABS2K1F8_9GAMM|nr:hypothetical protein [Dyella flava]MBM7124148.1 hypothetical protein [Dyella flava]GLQ50050.1 hypothetical protein GCM10010872_14990 [Dyella flava]
MSQITATVRLRPIRFGFLVRPNDAGAILEILQINTCLWGGRFNPIIPYFQAVPKWWDRRGYNFDTAKQIINGYLDHYEPDFLVEAEKGLADGFGFNANRVLQLSGLITRQRDRLFKGVGLNVYELYSELYEKEFKFTLRHAPKIKIVEPMDPALMGFCGTVFGCFPTHKDLRYIEEAYRYAFDPTEVVLNAASLADLYSSASLSPLDIGGDKIEIRYPDYESPTLFIMKANQSRDLIDFWNLRTLGGRYRAIPIEWIDELRDYCTNFIEESHAPSERGQSRPDQMGRILYSRSITDSEMEGVLQKIRPGKSSTPLINQSWYPRIWHSGAAETRLLARPILKAKEKTFHLTYTEENTDIRFDSIHPDFADEYGSSFRWANVVSLRDWSFENKVATAFPVNYRDPTFSTFRVGKNNFLATTEGFVLFPSYRNVSHHWSLSDGFDAISKWLKNSNIEVSTSPSGRVTQQIVQTLGGFGGVGKIANESIVRLLQKMSKSTSKSMGQGAFSGQIKNATKSDPWLDEAEENLIRQNAVELGLEIKCSKCSSWNWYALRDLDYKVQCSLCLKEFSFPILEPTNSSVVQWAYRLVGPFALPDYAQGGYAASLAMHFIANVAGSNETKITWTAGVELTLGAQKKLEADFILWRQRTRTLGADYPTEIIFGEAKSFGSNVKTHTHSKQSLDKDVFTDDDVKRMMALAQAFPGSVLVFSTMKSGDKLSKDDRKRLRRIAVWGREYVKETRRTRAPVIVLTGAELFTTYSLEDTWKAIGGRHEQLLGSHPELNRLGVLADLTQQLYLSMPSYSVWANSKFEKRRAKTASNGSTSKPRT